MQLPSARRRDGQRRRSGRHQKMLDMLGRPENRRLAFRVWPDTTDLVAGIVADEAHYLCGEGPVDASSMMHVARLRSRVNRHVRAAVGFGWVSIALMIAELIIRIWLARREKTA